MDESELKRLAQKVLEDYLTKGEVETRKEITLDARGNVVNIKKFVQTKPCPLWVIEYVLGKTDLNNAISLVHKHGYQLVDTYEEYSDSDLDENTALN